MNEQQIVSIPLPTIRRFPLYLRLLKDRFSRGEEWISATSLAVELRLKPIQVRKDMACTGVEGKPKIGFRVPDLIEAIEHHLGWDNVTDAVLVGAGNLGTALAGYEGFTNYGLKIIAAFDNDPKKIGSTLYGIPVFHMNALKSHVERLGVNMAVLTVPADFAQQTAEELVDAGIKGIWNFAPKNIQLPEEIIIQRIDLAASFAELSSKLLRAMKGQLDNGAYDDDRAAESTK